MSSSRNTSCAPMARGLMLIALPCLLASCNNDGSSSTSNSTSSATGAAARHAAAHRASLLSPAATAASLPVTVEIFAPEDGDKVGLDGLGWFIDLAIEFEGDLHSTGFVRNQLTGPGVHENAPPFPGTFTPGKDDRFGGLVVLISTSTVGAGSCQNLSNLFNLTGVTNRVEDETEIWDTWIITSMAFGRHTPSTVWVAEAADLDHNGVHDDAPDVVSDANHDGKCDGTDLQAVGLDSEVEQADFFIR